MTRFFEVNLFGARVVPMLVGRLIPVGLQGPGRRPRITEDK